MIADFNNRNGILTSDIVVVGGGLGGIISSILLARAGWSVRLIEKKQYPFHRVCGEYISNETIPFLVSNGLFPVSLNPERISRLQLTSVNGKSAEMELEMGGFGVSRYSYDYFLYEIAKNSGVVVDHTEVESISFHDDHFIVATNTTTYKCKVAIGAFGKRSKLDHSLKRSFIKKRSPYVGVKYHIKSDHQQGSIALHNFKNGYCGISNIEDGKTNLCYLTHRSNMREHGNVRKMEEEILFRNPFIKKIFEKADFLWQKPEVINEISFATKAPVEHHVLMVGDAAGMITPLCGNGMAMAIHSSKLASEWVDLFLKDSIKRKQMESGYEDDWKSNFAGRLWAGRQVQRLFGSEKASDFAVNLANRVHPVANFLVRQTHGRPF